MAFRRSRSTRHWRKSDLCSTKTGQFIKADSVASSAVSGVAKSFASVKAAT